DEVVAGRVGERTALEAVASRAVGVLVGTVADPDLDARVAEVKRCAASQVAVPKHGNGLPIQSAGRRVPGAVYLHSSLSWPGHVVRTRVIDAPVLAGYDFNASGRLISVPAAS